MNLTIPLPRYRCHKEVSALKIRAVIENPRGFELHFDDDRFAPHQVSTDWLEKHGARAGGYLVVYEDGYQSWSPAAAFESGYTLLEATDRSLARAVHDAHLGDDRPASLTREQRSYLARQVSWLRKLKNSRRRKPSGGAA